MRFDPNDPKNLFSTERELDPETRQAMLRPEYQNASEALRGMADMLRNTGNGSPGMKAKSVVFLILAVFVLAGTVIAAKTGHYRIALSIFGSVWLIGGLSVMFSKESTTFNASGTGMKQSYNGLFIFMIGLVLVGFAVASNYLNIAKMFVCGGGALFAVCGLMFLMPSVIDRIRGGGLVGEQIEGECIGYVRGVHRDSGDSGPAIPSIVTSSVFRYYYNGQMYEAIDSYMVYDKPGAHALGETVTLTIDKKDPYYVTSVGKRDESKAGSFMSFVFPSVFIVVGLGLLWYGATHDIKESELKDGNKASLTDSVINEKVGNTDWEIEEITVTDKHYDEGYGAWIVLFDEDTGFTCTEEVSKSYEVGKSYFIIWDSEHRISAVYAEKDWNYEGSHEFINKKSF